MDPKYYPKEDLLKLPLKDLLKFAFKETSYQETLNAIRRVEKEVATENNNTLKRSNR